MLATLAFAIAAMNQIEPADLTKGRKLVFVEEFKKPGMVNEKNWVYEVGKIRNKEAQYYTKARKENARIEGGNLIIEAIKEPYEGSDITSASIQSRKAWLYGYFEVRAKVPSGKGTWPAIWFLGESARTGHVGWPKCGEIDLMEHVGWDPDNIHFTIHCQAYNHMIHTERKAVVKTPGAETDFHTYGLDWHPDRLDFYLDGKRVFRYQNENDGKDKWPFDEPEFLILNLAIGGTWGGGGGIDENMFPSRFLVDYVRIYQ